MSVHAAEVHRKVPHGATPEIEHFLHGPLVGVC